MATTLGQRLRALRQERNLYLRDVADAAVVAVSYISDIEHDRTVPRLDILVRMAIAFDMQVVDILRGVPPYDAK